MKLYCFNDVMFTACTVFYPDLNIIFLYLTKIHILYETLFAHIYFFVSVHISVYIVVIEKGAGQSDDVSSDLFRDSLSFIFFYDRRLSDCCCHLFAVINFQWNHASDFCQLFSYWRVSFDAAARCFLLLFRIYDRMWHVTAGLFPFPPFPAFSHFPICIPLKARGRILRSQPSFSINFPAPNRL